MTTYTILDTTEYGVPSGNYDGSSQDWMSPARLASNYYRGNGGVQTILFDVTDFEGTMNLEGQEPDTRFMEALLREEEEKLLKGPNSALWKDDGTF